MIKKLIAYDDTVSGIAYYCKKTNEFFVLVDGDESYYSILYHCADDYCEPGWPAKEGDQFEFNGKIITLLEGGTIEFPELKEKFFNQELGLLRLLPEFKEDPWNKALVRDTGELPLFSVDFFPYHLDRAHFEPVKIKRRFLFGYPEVYYEITDGGES